MVAYSIVLMLVPIILVSAALLIVHGTTPKK